MIRRIRPITREEFLNGPKARPRGRAIKRPEEALQTALVAELRLRLPPPCLVWYVPNGGGKFSPQLARKLKGLGLLAGVHDIHVMWPGGFGTLECKRPDGKGELSPDQAAFGRSMERCGHPWVECSDVGRGVEMVGAWIAAAGFALRGRVLGGP